MASPAPSQSIEEKKDTVISSAKQRKPSFPRVNWQPPAALTPAQQSKLPTHRHSSAQNALTHYGTTSIDHEKKSEARARALKVQQQRRADRKDLEDLERSVRHLNGNKGGRGCVPPFAAFGSHQQQPLHPNSTDKLAQIVHRAFPLRMELPVLICDIKIDKATITPVRMEEIESWWQGKPDDVIVRWIHAPLGNGVVHSSIEDMFRHYQPMGRPFRHAGPAGFPYLDLASLQFRETEELEHMRTVHRILNHNEKLRDHLNATCWNGDQNETFKEDVIWRLDHLGQKLDYWDVSLADVPLELTETFSSSGGGAPLRPGTLGKGPLDPSILAKKDEHFTGTHLVWAPFRFFHRSDGMLLTMSAANGVDQLDRDFKLHLQEIPEDRLQNPDACVIASQMKALEREGASKWPELTVEYFLVRLVTEIGSTPNNVYGGFSTHSLLSALQLISKDLKSRRYEPWVAKETTDVVRDNIIFLDELQALNELFKRRVAFFEKLEKDVAEHAAEEERRSSASSASSKTTSLQDQKEETPSERMRWNVKMGSDSKVVLEYEPDEKENTAAGRVQWALKASRESKAVLDSLLEDKGRALEPFIQLGALEQAEREFAKEGRENAVFIFTGVTVVFLPLSFLCSYYGMNFEDIRKTTKVESYFWEVAGPLTVIIVGFIGLCTFFYRSFRGQLTKRRRKIALDRVGTSQV